MDDDKKECWNCRWYSPAYTKGCHRFDRRDFGMCRHEKIVQKHDRCGKWTYNTDFHKHVSQAVRREAALKTLNELLQQLAELSQILAERFEE